MRSNKVGDPAGDRVLADTASALGADANHTAAVVNPEQEVASHAVGEGCQGPADPFSARQRIPAVAV